MNRQRPPGRSSVAHPVRSNPRVPAFPCHLTEADSAIVEAIERMGRPVTSRELRLHSWAVKALTRLEFNDALLGLSRRGILRRVSYLERDLVAVRFGFPEQFDEEARG